MSVEAYIKETRESAYSVTVDVSGHNFIGDEPISYGGGDLGPAPYDLFVAAIGTCNAMTIRTLAIRQSWPLENVEVYITYAKKDASEVIGVVGRIGKVEVIEKRIILHGEALTDQQREALLDAADDCPLQRTIKSDVIIRTIRS